jgi:hypothetical protein
LSALGVALSAAALERARAQEHPFEAFTRFLTTREEYRGPRVRFPDAVPRPQSQGWVLRSLRQPLTVHAPAGLPRSRVLAFLGALEAGYEHLSLEGWPLPYPDGGAGGSGDFDVYLVPDREPAATAHAEQPIAWDAFDAATSFAVLDSELPESSLPRCALSALVQAGLLGQDPAETSLAREVTAAFVTWLAHGELGCGDGLAASQARPELGLLGESDASVASAARMLTLLASRHARSEHRFVRELWQLARQRSEGVLALHARPAFWQALQAVLDKAGESLDQAAIELALARYGLAPGAPLARESLAHVPVVDATTWGALPRHTQEPEALLATYGSAYARVDVRGAGAGARLSVWLRGEPGVRWSLVCVRLSSTGRELGRVLAPPRPISNSFVPLELTADTSAVLIVVTKLPWKAPGEFGPELDAHGFRLILNRG